MFVSVIVSREGVFVPTVLAEKALLIKGSGKFKLALVATRLDPLLLVSPPTAIVLVKPVTAVPERVAVTSTVIVQEPLPGITPPLSLIPAAPAANAPLALSVKVPPHELVKLSGEATVMAPPAGKDAGNTSVNAALFAGVAELLLSTRVSLDVAPGAMLVSENDLAMLGATKTSRLAEIPVANKPPLRALMLVELLRYVPCVLLVTFTTTVQDAAAKAKLPLFKVTLLAVLLTLPPHWLTLGVPEIVKPAGSVSVNPKPGCKGLPVPLLMVKLRTETPPTPMALGLKALLNCVPTTDRIAVLLPVPAAPVSTLLTPPLVLA